jgi:hypothetical protein
LDEIVVKVKALKNTKRRKVTFSTEEADTWSIETIPEMQA